MSAGDIESVTAGAGLTGGGTSGDVTLDVVAADGTITVNANSIAVGTIAESQVTNLTTDLAAKVPTSRQVISGAGLTGGGDLSADRTLNVVAADGTITVNADSIQVGTIAESQVTNLTTDLAAKATDSLVVHLAGTETATGAKTFTAPISMSAVAAPGSPVEGDTWTDSTQKSSMAFVDGVKQALSGVIYTATATVTVGNTTTETSIIGTGVGTLSLPANFFLAGKTILITLTGLYSVANNTDTVRVRLYKGGIGGTVILDTGTITSGPVAGLSNKVFKIEMIVTASSATSVKGSGYMTYRSGTVAADSFGMDATTPVTISTAAEALDVSLQWGTAAAGDTITTNTCIVEVLN